MNYKDIFANELYHAIEKKVEYEIIMKRIEKPSQESYGDFAFPCFDLAKIMRRSPQQIAQELAEKVEHPAIERCEPVGAYLNIYLEKSDASSAVIGKILEGGKSYGTSDVGQGGKVPIDMSSPNIAKPFSMGHLRSTVIGNSLALILYKIGYEPVRINHLGDWGTQFGKLIAAYLKWGDEEKVRQNTIKELLTLYIKFHEEIEKDAALEDEGRGWFKRLEDGDEQAVALWKWFREESLQEFNRIYDLMDISFDSTNGEAFYNDKMDRVVDLLNDKGFLKESEGALVVEMEDDNLPPCLIKKKDGATLYATRDLAAAIYRYETYRFSQSLYVVGNEQSLHFKQLIEVLKKLEFDWADHMHHISFGMMLKDGKKMSTRKGKVVLLEEVLEEAIQLANVNIESKNPTLQNKSMIAQHVGVGAVMFHDLKNDRRNDIDFSLESMLRVEGETGPYVQYTNARACSILRKGQYSQGEVQGVDDEQAWPIIMLLNDFPEVIQRAGRDYDPSLVAKYVLDLSRSFNKYYGQVRILDDKLQKEARLNLVAAVSVVLTEGLRLLGLHAPQEM
ncbi:arginine--tRNA ligase [Guptibacillus algicola]|uniref:arginine--tRNA ligase n=1 Tax=Guptibacillus algicola TaxID=225844 RepID=UPI001CD817A2|nr:arginine--tRNA ligase [Alkalihalobacillus algicola]MCA0989084.1 arginine--tRNA ligase [Alkalihalobacillus algicola]